MFASMVYVYVLAYTCQCYLHPNLFKKSVKRWISTSSVSLNESTIAVGFPLLYMVPQSAPVQYYDTTMSAD